MVIVLLRSGGILDTHKREFIDPVDLGNFQKQPEVSTGSVFINVNLGHFWNDKKYIENFQQV